MTGKDSKHSTPAGRKAKPRDLGEVHKPSRKVALNEVLQSLQDLVHNELSLPDKTSHALQDSAAPAKRESGHRAEAIGPGTTVAPPARDNEPPPARKSEPRTARPARSSTPPASEPSPPVIPPGGLQQELPYLDPVETAVPTPMAPAPEAEPPPTEPPEPVLTPAVEFETEASELAPLEPLREDHEPAPPTVTTAAEEGDLSEIPVLEDIIDFNDEPEPRAEAPAVPPAADARRLAIQVAARLNVELRKAGKPSLSSDVITRLARLLEEALAKAGTNMENSPPEKH